MRGHQALVLISLAPACSAFGFPGYPAPPPALPPSLYNIEYPFTFSSAGKTGQSGPDLNTLQSHYSSAGAAWALDSAFFTEGTYRGYQLWTVPQTGTYKITAMGAQGGAQSNAIGYGAPGAKVSATFDLVYNQKLEIIVGQGGGGGNQDPHGNSAGGGGGTFVLKYPRGSVTENDILLIAGGGGGAPSTSYSSSCVNYSDRSLGNGQGGTATITVYCNGGRATSAASAGYGGSTSGSHQGGAGGGFRSGGANGGTHCATAIGGYSVQGGLQGGNGDSCYTSLNRGGFGGGGGGNLGSPGAGGGYSGGSTYGQWSSYSTYGGGGSSYSNGDNTETGLGDMVSAKGRFGTSGEVVVELVSVQP